MNSTRAERLRTARSIPSTGLGKAAGAIAIVLAVVAVIATWASLRSVTRNLGAFALGGPAMMLLTYISSGALLFGGIGLLARKSWGWWATIFGALLGLAGLARLYAGLFAIIDPEHPRAGKTVVTIVQLIAGPALLYLGVVVLLAQRRLRETFRISSERSEPGRRSVRA